MQEQREITVGVSNRVSAEVVSGLQEGDRVIAGSAVTANGRTQNGSRQGQNANRPARIGGFP